MGGSAGVSNPFVGENGVTLATEVCPAWQRLMEAESLSELKLLHGCLAAANGRGEYYESPKKET